MSPTPLLSNSSQDKRVIVKFVNQKNAEALLKDKKRTYMSLTKFLYQSPFAHTIDILGVNVRISKGKERYTMFFV